MGTRADFYLGRGPESIWLGSISWDGYPAGIDRPVLTATTKEEYGRQLAEFLVKRDDTTWPVEPWPWPWDNSRITDYAYAFDPDTSKVHATHDDYWFTVNLGAPLDGEPGSLEDHASECEVSGAVHVAVHAECEGYPFDAQRDEADRVSHPDMSGRKGSFEHTMGRSGLMVVTPGGVADTKTTPTTDVAALGAAYILAATGAVTELAPLPAGPGESGYDYETFYAAVKLREVQRGVGVLGPVEPAEDGLIEGLADLRRRVDDQETGDIPLEEITRAPERERPLGHHMGQLVDGESSPANRPGWAEPEPGYAARVDDAVAAFVSDPKAATDESDMPEGWQDAAREGLGDNPTAQTYAAGYAAGEAAGAVKAELELTADVVINALTDLRRWIDAQPEAASEVLATQPLLREIERRIATAKGEATA